MQKSKLFTILPDYIATPDGMAIDQYDNLVLSCPNFADDNLPGCVVKIDKEKNITKWFDVPTVSGINARPMGIAFDSDYNLYICDNPGWLGYENYVFRGRILRVVADDNGIVSYKEVATGLEHPNGIRIRGGYMYVTQSSLSLVDGEDGLLVSCVYRFKLDDENIMVTNTLEDENIITTFITLNEKCQYGADGIEFDDEGNMYVGNFGDGAVHKITFDEQLNVTSNEIFAQNSKELVSTDGIAKDKDGNLYIADFSNNAIVKVSMDKTVTRIAQSPDSNGLNGELDQPGEPIVWDNKIIVSCFDLVTDEGKVNTNHEMPATLAMLEL